MELLKLRGKNAKKGFNFPLTKWQILLFPLWENQPRFPTGMSKILVPWQSKNNFKINKTFITKQHYLQTCKQNASSEAWIFCRLAEPFSFHLLTAIPSPGTINAFFNFFAYKTLK